MRPSSGSDQTVCRASRLCGTCARVRGRTMATITSVARPCLSTTTLTMTEPSVWVSSHVKLFLRSLSPSLSLPLSLSPSPSLSLSLSLYFPLSLSPLCPLSFSLSISLPLALSLYLSKCAFISLSIYLSIYLSVDLSICRSIYLSIYLSIYPSSVLPV